MPASIAGLLEAPDNSEIIRDQIAALLVVESENQQQLAIDQGKDPAAWMLRVYVARSNPWNEFLIPPDTGSVDATPIVNVSFETAQFPENQGNTIYQQRADGRFHIDCFGYGVSQDTPEGHDPGDEAAEREAHRALRLCRQILMHSAYHHLGLPRGIIGRRWPETVTIFRPTSSEGQPVQHVVGARLALKVLFNEFAPQVEGVPLESVLLEVTHAANGRVLLRAEF